jgi:hypothetical protein
MELNRDMVDAATQLARRAEEGSVTLPAALFGFRHIFIAVARDDTISAMGAIVTPSGLVYKIGPERV